MFTHTEWVRAAAWVRHPFAALAEWFRHPDPAGDRELRWYPVPTGRADADGGLAASQKFIDYQPVHQPAVKAICQRFAVAVMTVDYGLGSGRPIERIFIAPNSRLLVGSNPGCDVVICGAPKCAEFIADDDSVRMTDLGSGAGTFTEGENLPTGKRRKVSPGDVVHVPPHTTITCHGLPDC
jgi:hypothetical protein